MVSALLLTVCLGAFAASPRLHDAVRSGDLQPVEAALAAGADPNESDDWGRSALLVAAQLRNTAAIERLLRARSDVNAANRNDITPLIAAAQTGNRDAAALLLGAGAALDRQDNLGWTALMWAAYRKDETIVQALLDAGADAALSGSDGQRAIDVARRMGASASLLDRLAAKTPETAPRPPAPRRSQQQVQAILAAPKVSPALDPTRIVRGHPAAPVMVFEYTDFQCPYCAHGARVMEEVLARYEGQVRLVVKHLPLPQLHPMATPAALRFEALALQDPAKAWAFYDRVFRDPRALGGGESALDRLVGAELGADLQRLADDLRGERVRGRVEADLREAAALRFDGVPVFVIEGHVIAGAQAPQVFFDVVDALLRR